MTVFRRVTKHRDWVIRMMHLDIKRIVEESLGRLAEMAESVFMRAGQLDDVVRPCSLPDLKAPSPGSTPHTLTTESIRNLAPEGIPYRLRRRWREASFNSSRDLPAWGSWLPSHHTAETQLWDFVPRRR